VRLITELQGTISESISELKVARATALQRLDPGDRINAALFKDIYEHMEERRIGLELYLLKITIAYPELSTD